MKKLLLALFLLGSTLAFSQATVTGHVSDISNTPAAGTTAVQFDLVNCGQTFAKVNGVKVLFPLTKTFSVTNGAFTGTLRGNDVIDCGGTFNTYYRVTRLFNGIKVGAQQNFIIPDSGTWILETANPVAVVPPDTVIPYATFKPRGTYTDLNTYGANDLVQYGGSTWRAKASIAAGSNIAPGTDATKWEQWAAAGTGLADPGNTGLVKRTTAGITIIANASDVTDTLGFIPANVSDLVAKANDSAVLHNTGDENVAGKKTLSNRLTIQTTDSNGILLKPLNDSDAFTVIPNADNQTSIAFGVTNAANNAWTFRVRKNGIVDLTKLQVKGVDYVQPLAWNVENLIVADSGRFQVESGIGGTAVRISCSTKSTTPKTVSVNVELRSSPNTTGTALLASPLTCDEAGASTSTFSTSVVPANTWLALTISASDTPEVTRVQLNVRP